MVEAQQLEVIWNRYSRRLLGFLMKRADSPDDAEDLRQEVFVRLAAGLCCMGEWEGMERLVYRTARNLLIDRYRAKRPSAPLDEEAEAAYGAPDLDQEPAARLALSLREDLDALPQPYRGALLATEYEGLTQAAYAEREGISLAAAKSRVLRGRERFKKLLLDCCAFELDRRGGIIDYRKRCPACDFAARTKSAP